MTREEWLKSLPTEELAKFIAHTNNGGNLQEVEAMEHIPSEDVQQKLEWLKEVHHE